MRARTSPADTKELPAATSFPFSPDSDSESEGLSSGNPEQGMGLTRTSQAGKVVCKVLIPHPENSNLFLFGLRRDDHAWCNPGGHAEPGETPEEAMLREFQEECGVPLESAELVYSQDVPEKNLVVHVFIGPPAEPDFWLSLDNSGDPDSEFACYQFIDPLDTDLPLHIPLQFSAVGKYLRSPEKAAYANSLLDLTTEKEASEPKPGSPGYAEKFSQSLKSKLGQGPDAKFMRTDEKIKDSYHDENQFEDADLHMGSLIKEAQDDQWVTMSGHPVLLDHGTVKSGPAKGTKLPDAKHEPLKELEKKDKAESKKLEPKRTEGSDRPIHQKDKDAAIDNLAGSIKDKDWDSFMDHMDEAFKSAQVGEVDAAQAAQIGRSHNLTFGSDPDNEDLHKHNKEKRGKDVKDPSIIIEFEGKYYALDGQHRLNNAIKDKKPANVAVLKGDFLKKFGITEKTFEGKKTWDKESSAEPYSSGGFSPADPMLEDTEEVQMVQHARSAVSTENSKGLGFKEENEREDIALMKDLSVRTPAGPL